jgi:hypothetical protein
MFVIVNRMAYTIAFAVAKYCLCVNYAIQCIIFLLLKDMLYTKCVCVCVCVCVAVTIIESVPPNLAGLHYSYYFVSAGCGGVLTGLSGRLQYPHSGSIQYGHNVNCAWLITTNTTKVLQLNFTKFDVEHSPNCEFDFLQVQYPLSRSTSVYCWNSCDVQFLTFVILCMRFTLCF